MKSEIEKMRDAITGNRVQARGHLTIQITGEGAEGLVAKLRDLAVPCPDTAPAQGQEAREGGAA